MHQALRVGLLAALVSAGFAADSQACDCAGPGAPCVATVADSVVFVGRVLTGGADVTFDVERPLHGAAAGVISIRNGYPNCGFEFRPDERYLVYAYTDTVTGRLRTGLCSRTRLLRDPGVSADLAFFELAPKDRSKAGVLTGAVIDMTKRLGAGGAAHAGLSGIRVTVQPADGRPPLRASTRPDGSFRFTGLRPGVFSVTADLPQTFETAEPLHLVVAEKSPSCVSAVLSAFIDGRLSGRLMAEDGQPARGVEIFAMHPTETQVTNRYPSALTATSDEEGRFHFRRVAPGPYVLGVGLWPRPRPGQLNRRRYFGETRDPAAATIVDMGLAEHRELAQFKLVPLPAERTVTVVVDGPRPAVESARIFVTAATRKAVEHVAGRLTLPLPYGAAFVVEVVPPEGYRARPATVRIERDDEDRTIEVRLERP